jgi:hypothetical protein
MFAHAQAELMHQLHYTAQYCIVCSCCVSSGIATAPPAPPQQTVLENAAERAVKTAEKVLHTITPDVVVCSRQLTSHVHQITLVIHRCSGYCHNDTHSKLVQSCRDTCSGISRAAMLHNEQLVRWLAALF